MRFLNILALILMSVLPLYGEYLEVMEDELGYTMDNMHIGGFERPFYSAYTFRDMDIIKVRSE